ncbi:TLC domain-containing protein At5g14285-like [Aristolochia californica]|uniref:TLC domain-containing protein At5g14285-like n=1 Tax=Aristolochia californica TaxID=171875 RepID=UPI0035DFC104
METETLTSSFLPIIFPAFIAVYLFAYFVVFRNWSPKLRPVASSCLISLAHGTPAAVMAYLSISDPYQSGFASPNSIFQNLVLDFSISYFLVDLLHYLVFFPSDVLFIGHHLATLFVFATCRYLVFHGAFAILVLLMLAEITSFCQNTWTLANARKDDLPAAAKLYAMLSPPFYVFYTMVRGVAGPYFVYKMGMFYWSGEADYVIPRWLWISWIAVVITAISLSILWISNLWLELFRERSARMEQKKKR